jgi:G3E family GTPase
MDLHLVNGFLGSGKTTGIIAATKHLMRQGKLVGIITNDKGQFQVDRSFFEASDIPTRQVTGGCFRCSFSEFEGIIAELQDAASPDVIFAESVGSCVDLVNTIFDPLQKMERIQVAKTTYSVFTDSRLVQIWIQNEPLPFSDHINYLFEKQIEEGHLLIINKADLLTGEEQKELQRLVTQKFPNKVIFFQNSKDELNVLPWLRALEREGIEPTRPEFKVDYPRYKAGEQEMAWLDQKLTFRSASPERLKPALIDMITQLLSGLQAEGVFVAHIKFLISTPNQKTKLSFTTADLFNHPLDSTWIESIPDVESGALDVMLNARLSMDAHGFHDQVNRIVTQVAHGAELEADCEEGSAYHPDMSMDRP